MRTIPLQRKGKCILDEKQISEFYSKVLLPLEIDDIDLTGYNADSQEIKHLKNRLGFDFGSNGEIKTDADALVDTFYLKPYKSYSLPASLWVRVRNALAHNRIFKDKSGNFILENFYRGKLTMYAKVSSIEKLLHIIEGIRQSKISTNIAIYNETEHS